MRTSNKIKLLSISEKNHAGRNRKGRRTSDARIRLAHITSTNASRIENRKRGILKEEIASHLKSFRHSKWTPLGKAAKVLQRWQSEITFDWTCPLLCQRRIVGHRRTLYRARNDHARCRFLVRKICMGYPLGKEQICGFTGIFDNAIAYLPINQIFLRPLLSTG